MDKSVKSAVLNEWILYSFDLRIGKKGYILDDIWEKCKHVHGGTLYSWHDDGFEEEERQKSGLDGKYYDTPPVCIETFEVKVQRNDPKGDGHNRKCSKGDVDPL
ncbi:hypothetical protein Tco_0756528 [Tanacetum coccineum]